MYLENTFVGDGKRTFSFVPRERQQRAVQFLLDEVLSPQPWLFSTPLTQYTYINRRTPVGVQEMSPTYSLTNQQSYVLWDLLDNERLVRMLENEKQNGSTRTFTAIDLIDKLHNHIFSTTIAGRNPDIAERSLQKNFVDALITAAAEQEGVKINKKLNNRTQRYINATSETCSMGCPQHLSSAPRIIELTGSQATRVSDAISVKRGELLRILKLMKARMGSANTAARLHYEDVALRIQTALGLSK